MLIKLFERPDGQLDYKVETGETGYISADGDTRERLFDQYKITEYEIRYNHGAVGTGRRKLPIHLR